MRVALVTGANQGIGYEIVRKFAQQRNIQTLLGARDMKKGKEAAEKLLAEEKLNNNEIEAIHIDIEDLESIKSAAKVVKEKYGGLDILVNNAGFAFKGSRFDEEVCRTSCAINYFGTRNVIETFLPLMKPNARVVNVSSMAGRSFLQKMNQDNRNKFMNEQLTVPQLDNLLENFFNDVKNNDYEGKWSTSGYGASKAALSLYTRILARDVKEPHGITFNALCPGFVSTSMSSYQGHKTPSQGAETPVHCALIPPGDSAPNGQFFENCKVSHWI
jgi:carbonyl reductase 1